MEKRICPECGAEFAPSYGTQRYCSDNCSRNAEAAREAARSSARDYKLEYNLRKERRERERRRAEFFAARDEAFAKIGLPPPRITENADGSHTLYRGHGFGSRANCGPRQLLPTSH